MSNDMNFRLVIKDRLYYDRWQYGMNFCIDEASALRELDHDSIDQIIKAREHWRNISQQRWNRGSTILMSGRRKKFITAETARNLHELADVLIQTKHEFKIVISFDIVWIYSNHPELFEQVKKLCFISDPSFTQASVKLPRNTVVLKKSPHKYRSYFRTYKLTMEQKQQLSNFLSNNQTHVRLSPSLTAWLNNKFLRVQDYFFVDYTADTWMTMLALIDPRLIRKTMQIQQAK
jgi:hypothetical protein